MILYVNGDSHAAAAECVNSHAWAKDDGFFWGLDRMPHPDNEKASFGCELANWLFAVLYLDAQAGCSNTRIMRTTREWIKQNPDAVKDCFMVIQWTTWEREEWWHEGHDFQVNASGIDDVPEDEVHEFDEHQLRSMIALKIKREEEEKAQPIPRSLHSKGCCQPFVRGASCRRY